MTSIKTVSAHSRPRRLAYGRSARWVLTAPLLLFTAVFLAFPFYQGIQTSFFDFTLYNPIAQFNGLTNYDRLFHDPDFAYAAIFTICFALVVTAIEVILGFGLALLVNRDFHGKKIIFAGLLLPIMIAPALLGVMFRLLLNSDIGLIPPILAKIGIHVSLFSPQSIVPLLVALDILQWTPFTFLVLYAGLQSFPNDVLEAAAVDGSSWWRTLGRIVIPILKPVIAAAVFLRIIDALRTFDVIYVLTAGGPGSITTTLSIYIYKTAFANGDFGLASAASVVIMIVLLPFVPLLVGRVVQSEGAK